MKETDMVNYYLEQALAAEGLMTALEDSVLATVKRWREEGKIVEFSRIHDEIVITVKGGD
jgi:hypothetical protein